MAKQTFTTGQVLTAAQMTSLQQTAMGGGSTTAKTTSYVLVAADAGTVVQMNAAGATTITVNTALFSAGDSVQIQNIGAGVCTITAGTATVTTAGSLALSQWEGGNLYFTSTSASIFFDIVQGSGMTNPMTTTGDMVYSSSGSTPARLGIGTTGQVVTVAGGIPSWATPASGGGLTLLSTTTFNNSVTNYTVSSISGSYKNLLIVGTGLQDASTAGSIGVLNWNFNADTGNNYSSTQIRNNAGTIGSNGANAYSNVETGLTFAATTDTSIRFGNFQFIIYNYASTSLVKAFNAQGGCGHNGGLYTNTLSGQWNNSTDAITSVKFTNAQGTNLKAGTIQIYGVA